MYLKFKGALLKRAFVMLTLIFSFIFSFLHGMDRSSPCSGDKRSFHLSVILSVITTINLQDTDEARVTGNACNLIEFMTGESNISIPKFCGFLLSCGDSLQNQFPALSLNRRLKDILATVKLSSLKKKRPEIAFELCKKVGAELFFIPRDKAFSSNVYYLSVKRL